MSKSGSSHNSAQDTKTTESGKRASKGCIDECPLQSRGPHAVVRKKYKESDLNTTGLQCSCDSNTAQNRTDSSHSKDIQCDIPNENEEAENVCPTCRCTAGFCNELCEKNKQKVSQNRSDSQAGKASAIPVAVKRRSAPGLTGAVPGKATCTCVAKCAQECEKQKMKAAIGAIKSDDSNKGSGLSKCEQNKCTSRCNTAIQTDMDEPPIDPLAPVPMNKSTDVVAPKTEDSNVCIACQCNGPCSPKCLLKKENIKHLFNEDDMNVTSKEENVCKVCDCTDGCTEACLKVHNQTAEAANSCICPWDCSGKVPAASKDNQTEAIVQVCNCETMCNSPCDQFKVTQTSNPPQVNQEVACDICKCVGVCSEACKNKNNTKPEKEDLQSNSVCKICKCAKKCNTKCEEAKNAKPDETKICDVCTCCNAKCEENKVNKKPDEAPANTNEDMTQVRGVIEDFNDTDLIDKSKTTSFISNTKAKSSCDLPDEPICDTCKCQETCQTKCAAIRKIKSVSEFPPNNKVCEECKCQDKCTELCTAKKTNAEISCVTSAGQPIKCNEANNDWIPCVSCVDRTPCSPECRERMAIAEMTKPPGGSQSNEPVTSCATDVQTAAPVVISCIVQTCDAQPKTVTHATSTQGGLVTDVNECPAEPINQPATPANSAEACCSMCEKLRSYICSVFHNEQVEEICEASCSQKDKEPTEKNKPPQSCATPQPNKCNQQDKPRKQDPGPCKCTPSVDTKTSYTKQMNDMMNYLQASCEDAEIAATPFIKTQSAFTLDIGNQQEAILSLLHKCRQKDQYIDAMIRDLLDRSKSRTFESLLSRLQENNMNAPDFDSTLITSALDKNNVNTPVCGIDLMCFRVTSVKRVGPTAILVKWNKPSDGRVIGYDINVNGQMKMKIDKKETTYAILDALDLSCTITIEVYARAPNGRAFPSALAYYAKY